MSVPVIGELLKQSKFTGTLLPHKDKQEVLNQFLEILKEEGVRKEASILSNDEMKSLYAGREENYNDYLRAIARTKAMKKEATLAWGPNVLEAVKRGMSKTAILNDIKTKAFHDEFEKYAMHPWVKNSLFIAGSAASMVAPVAPYAVAGHYNKPHLQQLQKGLAPGNINVGEVIRKHAPEVSHLSSKAQIDTASIPRTMKGVMRSQITGSLSGGARNAFFYKSPAGQGYIMAPKTVSDSSVIFHELGHAKDTNISNWKTPMQRELAANRLAHRSPGYARLERHGIATYKNMARASKASKGIFGLQGAIGLGLLGNMIRKRKAWK